MVDTVSMMYLISYPLKIKTLLLILLLLLLLLLLSLHLQLLMPLCLKLPHTMINDNNIISLD